MIGSMTAFAQTEGSLETAAGPLGWSWELRSVNGKGLDVRLRLPEGLAALETPARAAIAAALGRGSVTAALRLELPAGGGRLGLDEARAGEVIAALSRIHELAQDEGLALTPPTAADLLAQRGVLESRGASFDPAEHGDALLDGLGGALVALAEMRGAEGAALAEVISGQLETIAALCARAEDAAGARAERQRRALSDALARVGELGEAAEPDRVAQELALIAVKSDVTEEIDRLRAHVEAARALLAQDAPVGRKLDFLAQEFAREANTLTAKSGHAALTQVGLELKVVVDRMREQIQNVE